MDYNVKLRRIRVTIIAEEKQYVVLHILSVCLYSYPRYATCKLHVPYYTVICGLHGSTLFFPQYFINHMIFGKKLLNIKCVFFLYIISL
jgi:hypothetical protein